MFRIAICDDDPEQLKQLQGILMNIEGGLGIEFHIDTFLDGIDLCNKCEQLEQNYYDVMIFDIMMKKWGGITAARFLRKAGWDETKYIFVSGFDKFLRQLYELDTAGFIDKPFHQKSVEEVFIPVYNKIFAAKTAFFQYTKDKIKQFVRSKDITYFEVDGHTIIMHLKSGEECFYDSLKNIWEELKGNPQFIMPCQSYIVNLDYVQKIDNKGEVCLSVDTKAPIMISRQYKECTMKQYMKYLGGRY